MVQTHIDAKVYHPSRGFDREDEDDQWMLNFGCEKTRQLKHFVKLPEDKCVFDENYNQIEPLEIARRDIAEKLTKFIREADEKIFEHRFRNAKTRAEKNTNSRLYNHKHHGIRSILRKSFAELDFSEDQFDWLEGKLKLSVDGIKVHFSMYSREKRAASYKKSKLYQNR